MDEGQGAQYAIQIAVQTLRDRCKNLQQRVALLEEENVNLRIQCNRQEEYKGSLDELDHLRAQVTELSEQKEQLQNKVKLVTNENQDLWSKLGKLTRVNKSLGVQLARINDTLVQHSSPSNNTTHQSNLIRSKTFTKSEIQNRVMQKNLEENDKISLELEDISLKLSNSFSKQKKELDILCSEINDMAFSSDCISTENCGFLLDEDLENDIFIEVQSVGDELKIFKDVVLKQQNVLMQNLKNIDSLNEKLQCKNCHSKKPKLEKGTSTLDLLIKKSFENKYTETDMDKSNSIRKDCSPSKENNHKEYPHIGDRICPLCSKVFHKDIDFLIFQQHVEQHFVPDEDSYELL